MHVTRMDRVYRIEALIRSRGLVDMQQLLDALEVSPATLKRDLEYLRDRLDAPIVYDRGAKGYRFQDESAGRRTELPGLWFSERELYGLLMVNQILGDMDVHGVIGRHLKPLLDRTHRLLQQRDVTASSLTDRVKVLAPTRRATSPHIFEAILDAVLRPQRILMTYESRGRGAIEEREASPQRLVHYRGTWYMDAWCHKRDRLLRFSLDAVISVLRTESEAVKVNRELVESEMDAGYGIYAGADPQWARLRVNSFAATWISREQWHSNQVGNWLPDGSYELKVPYTSETELTMDILRHGPNVEVLEPASLRSLVQERVRQMQVLYDGAKTEA